MKIESAKARSFFNNGLILTMVGLFVAAFQLNRNQYAASLSSVESSTRQRLAQQVENIKQRIEKQEAEQFALFQTDRILEADLFIVDEVRVVPACNAGLLEAVSAAEADEAFEKGVAALPDSSALAYFQIAAKRDGDRPQDHYKKIAALCNMLELKHEVRTISTLITLLDDPSTSLEESARQFFYSRLQEQVPGLENIQSRTSSLWKKSELIDRKLTRQKGAYRAAINGQTLSVTEEGVALLYSPDVQAAAPVELYRQTPPEPHQEIIPGFFASIPNRIVDSAKASIRKQYWAGNILLALMLVLGTGLAVGRYAVVKRQRRLEAMRTEFIATVSHELRTPLSLIRLHAETLKHGRIPDEKIADYHQTILTEAERLSGIVNNVLDFSRMERGKLQIHLEPIDLSTLVHHIADSFGDRLDQEGFSLERVIGQDIVATVDSLAYSQIVFNLLDNAIKYSDGSKTIRIELDVADGSLILRVADQGIGVPDKLKKHIFDEFVRVDDSRVTARRGSGIGLSVAKQLAEKMNGTIEVADNQPKGSVFTVSVPPASSGLKGRQDGGDTIEEIHETIGG